jgi:Prolipoprotein diacylglyceryl transferase
MVFPHPKAEGLERHPSQLYEAFFEGLVLFAVLTCFLKRSRSGRPMSAAAKKEVQPWRAAVPSTDARAVTLATRFAGWAA